jgi:SPOR domain
MAEQYDPKQFSRSPFERRPEPRAAAVRQEDPLAQLAKIVQGRPGLATPAAGVDSRPVNEANGASDLEAELLNDLQASFAAVREAAAPAPMIREAPQPLPPLPPRAYSVEPEPQTFAGPAPADSWSSAQTPSPPRSDARVELRPEFRPEPLDESRLVPIPSAPVLQPSIATVNAERQVERRAVAEQMPEYPPPDRVVRSVRAAQPQAPEAAPVTRGFQLRPTTAAVAPQAAPVRPPHSRWEQPEQAPQPNAAPSRFAPPQVGSNSPSEDAFDDSELDPFSEGGLFEQAEEVGEHEDPFPPLDGFGMAPGYGEDENAPPYGEEVAVAEGLRRPRRSLIVVGAVVAVALVGGVAVAMFRSGGASSGPPPTIVADGAPTKITPDDAPSAASSDADAQNKLIYDRVNSAEANTNTTLLTPDSGPIKDPASTGAADNAISRVILPGGPGFDAPTAEGATQAPAPGSAAAANPAANDSADVDESMGPRKVRTVVVRPDGTILSNNTAPAAAEPAPAPPPAASAGPAPAAPVTDDTAAIAGSNALAITSDRSAAAAGPASPPNVAAPPAPANNVVPAPAPVAAAPVAPAAPIKPTKAKPAPAPAAVAAADPIDVTPGGAAPASAQSVANGVLVQISSQRSEDAARATYRDLQTRYPNILGKYEVNLQRADVPVRGTFFRVRVGPFSATDAQRLCDDLKSAGGDCVLAKQ